MSIENEDTKLLWESEKMVTLNRSLAPDIKANINICPYRDTQVWLKEKPYYEKEYK